MAALIPARAGSKRVPGKNTRRLNGHPLLAYSIKAALESGVFGDCVYVCSDDSYAVEIAWRYGASTILRDPVADDEPDIAWVRRALKWMQPEAFAILRPTSPFRTAETIRRAYQQFTANNDCADSLRAVEPVTQHPCKMWVPVAHCPKGYEQAYPIVPLQPGNHPDGTPWHSSPTQTLPTVYVQTSALEMAWTRCVEVHGTIAGRKVSPFFGTYPELVSIDTEADWAAAERLARDRPDLLPPVGVARVSAAAEAQ